MKTYNVTFHYTVTVEADDWEQAEDRAWVVFLEEASHSDFVNGDPEEIEATA